LTESEARTLLSDYLRLLRPGGRVVLITPQERGFASDPTHVTFVNFQALRDIVEALGLVPSREYSFPFPRAFGRLFKYNEFVSISTKPSAIR